MCHQIINTVYNVGLTIPGSRIPKSRSILPPGFVFLIPIPISNPGIFSQSRDSELNCNSINF